MKKIKICIKQNKKGLAGSAAAVLCSLLGLILYAVTTANTNGKISGLFVALSIGATLLSMISLLLCYLEGTLSIVSAALFLYCMFMFVSSQADSIGYAATGITDIGYGIQGTLVFGGICYLIAVVGECVAVFGKRKTE